jgi:riboflavin biosynthesis pyrimidine reductase
VEPFDVLAEEPGLPAVELPPELARIYGDLGFAESCVYANFVATLDGVVAIPTLPSSNEVISGGSDADRFLMGVLRALADAVLVGAGVLRASPRGTWRAEKIYPAAAEAYSELRDGLGLPPAPEIAVLTGSGSLDPEHPVLAGRAVVLTSDAGAARLAGKVPETAALVSLGAEQHVGGAAIVEALRERGHRRILCEAGPHTFGTLLEAGRVDELFLTTSPFLAGEAGAGSRLRLVEAADLVPFVEGRLLSVRRHGRHLFTRYALQPT